MMKSILLIISFVLCNTFAIAQTSRYFDLKVNAYKTFKEIVLTPKNISEVKPKPSGPYDDRSSFKDMNAFNNMVTTIVKNAFKDIDKEDVSILQLFKFRFTFDTSMKIVYLKFEFDEEYSDKVMKLEKNMYDLSQKFLYMDISPYFEVENPSLFHHTE
ncbi:hypothetical protein DW083_04360 [Parabacteroides sp. AF48-14]|uniref:hypothetical protein n=1 Tax=Parabacteroides sp. AF48-14 TaxID=2292052 RepID=UPI000F00A543|nr:hypothetical protein [Parabacteroides sp. AF48-14]RHO74028.1 hypothetical protein DW083_04360 [Parabacteroides sp. AF48-14]